MTVPSAFLTMLTLADPSWRPILRAGLDAVYGADPAYLPALAADDYLPTHGRLFAAFSLPLASVAYVLVGEGPYPRAASATGLCFMDGAVGALWSETGLSKQVNRATSLRNFMKMLLVADGRLAPAQTTGTALASVAATVSSDGTIATLAELQQALITRGFLLLNAALVYRAHVPPVREARAWLPFLQVVLAALGNLEKPTVQPSLVRQEAPTLLLWGKIAEQVRKLPVAAALPQLAAEHPYNLSFINNETMLDLFRPMRLLRA